MELGRTTRGAVGRTIALSWSDRPPLVAGPYFFSDFFVHHQRSGSRPETGRRLFATPANFQTTTSAARIGESAPRPLLSCFVRPRNSRFTACRGLSTPDRRNLPLSRFCAQHILNDSEQQLYKACTGAESCQQPVVKCESPAVCDVHLELKHFETNPRLCVRATPTGMDALPPGFASRLPLLGSGLDDDLEVRPVVQPPPGARCVFFFFFFFFFPPFVLPPCPTHSFSSFPLSVPCLSRFVRH